MPKIVKIHSYTDHFDQNLSNPISLHFRNAFFIPYNKFLSIFNHQSDTSYGQKYFG